MLFKQNTRSLLLIAGLMLLNSIAFAQLLLPNDSFQWINAPKRVIILDSIIKQSAKYALNKSDYNVQPLYEATQQNSKLANYKDSITLDLAIQKTAVHFFNDLAYGNRPPLLDYRGAKFDMNVFNIPAIIKANDHAEQLIQLVQFLNQQSIEVKIILDTLNKLQASNAKNETKIKILTRAANDYRWLNAARKNHRMILANIPSAQLKVYDGANIILQMKLILGKVSTPTRTLSTEIKQVTLYPYWTVPKSIIVNEMLPKIKNDISYLSRNRLQVLGSNYKVINPYQINWHTIDLVNFPYIIRQATGCKNSLGILKLEFDSPFSMYLHDTPEKKLFGHNSRFYSHGCMRMEKPIEMGRLLLENNLKAIDTFDLTKCDENIKPTFIPIDSKIPLVVWYSLVDFDSNNKILFYKNIYNRKL